jgi:hypothetical protein
MDELTLLFFGAGVSCIAFAGAYSYLREAFIHSQGKNALRSEDWAGDAKEGFERT